MTARDFMRASVEDARMHAPADIEVALSDSDLAKWRAELMDQDSWGEILGTYGRTMRLAVALTDISGNILGACHNPQPVWSLARAGKAEANPLKTSPAKTDQACPFCLVPNSPCTAVADALAIGEVVFARDQAGLTHAAIPLLLGNQRLGALIAGQCFSEYPQPLSMQRVAKHFGAPPQAIWKAALHQVPVSRATLRLYADLLEGLGRAFLRQRYAAILNRRLLQTNERYRLMIEGSKDHGLFTVDRKGCVTSWNPGAERLLGYTELEIAGKDYARFFTPEDVQSGIPKRGIQQAEAHGWMEEESWQVRRDGTRFLSETLAARLGEGDAIEYGFLLRDVTEARKTADAVLQAQKLESIGVLASGIAHDFNNLLTGILGNVSLAMIELSPGDATRPLLEAAEQASLRAAGLVGQLLAYAGKGMVTVTRFDLSALVSAILPLIATSIPKAVRLDLSLPPGLPWIAADSTEVQQIIMNLVINGAEAVGPQGGSVRVSTGVAALNPDEEKGHDGVYLEVRDTGCGMDEATRQKIFDPFFTTKVSGRGLGLAAVSGIVRRLLGRLDVESVPGQGTTFRVVFPAAPILAAKPKVPVMAQPDGTGLILVVDDDPVVRNFARAVLQRAGYSVLIAENGQAAVDTFRINVDSITAVLMDLTMPVMGGLKAFHLMTEIQPDIPIIVSTGFSETDVREQFTGALGGIMPKPYTVSGLREKIAEVLALKKSRKPRTSWASGLT
jgi:PAS domain S-box-containing protein